MTLGEHLKEKKSHHIYLLWFNGAEDDVSDLNSTEYFKKDFCSIDNKFLNMEVMDTVEEDEYEEIWIR